MAKAVGNLVMHMTVDDSKVTPTINTMKQQLRDLNATWRANVDAAKAAGDSQEAARAKAEGLALAMAKQKEILDSMNTIMRNTGERTDSNALAYDRMASSISRAEAQYKNLTNQEQAALVILDKQETGIDELNRSIKANDDLTQAQIKSLKQQGDEFGANELKVQSLKEKQQSLNDVQEKEEQILKNIVARSGENSRAYTEQAAVVQNAKNNIAENNAELLKYNKRIESTNVQLKELKSSYSLIKEAQDSYITRLKAEGNQNEANVADLNKLKMAYANLGEQYKLQMTQLNSSSVGSKGYQEAYVAANKTATEMARVASQSRNTQNEINKMNPYGISKIGTALNTVSDAGDLMGKKVVGAYQAIRRNAATIALSVGVAGAALLKGAQTATDIQNSYVKTNNLLVTGGEKQKTVTEQVSQMQKDGAKYATEYGYSQQSIADGYQELVKRGYDGAQSIGSMRSLMQAARATGDEYSDVVRNTTTALENFNLRSDDTATMMKNTKTVTNMMAYAADMTATDFQSLGKAMEYVGTSAYQSGFSLSETSSAIGILSNNGLEADKAGTGLRKTISSLQAPTKTAAGALAELGLSTKDFVGQDGKMKSMTDIFTILHEKTKSLPQAEQGTIFHNLFGATGQMAGTILTDNADKLGALNKKVEESADGQGYVAKLSQKNMQTTKARLEQLKAILEKVAMSIGEAMLPAIDKAAKALEKAFNSKDGQEALKNTSKLIGEITNKAVDLFIFMGQHMEAIKIFGETLAGVWAVNKIGSYIASTKKAIGYIEDLLKKVKILQATEAVGNFKVPLATTGAGVTTSAVRAGVENGTLSRAAAGGAVSVGAGAVGAGTGSLTGASSLAGLAVAAAPIAAVVAGIAAVGAAATLAYKHIKEFKDFVNNTAKSVNDNFVKPLAQGFGYIGDTIADVSKAFAKNFGKGFDESSHHIKEAIDAVKKAFKDVGDDIGKALKPVTKKGGVIDGITDAMQGIGDWISIHKSDFKAIGEFFGKVFADITATLIGVGSMFVRVFGNMIPPLITGLVAVFKDVWKVISGLFSGLADIGYAIYHLFTGNFKGLGKDLKNIFKDVDKILGGIVGAVWDVVKTAFKMGLKGLDGLFQSVFGTGKNPIEHFFTSMAKSVDKFFKNTNKNIKKGLKDFEHWFSNGFDNIISGTMDSMAKMGQGISKGLDKIGKWFAERPKVFVNNWKHIFQGISDVAVAVFKTVQKGVSSFFKFITNAFKNTTKFIAKLWKDTWNGISEFFEKIWNGIKKFFTPIINWLGDVIDDTVKSISKTWSKTWNGISDFFSGIWKTMKKTGSNAVNSLHDTFFDVLGKIGRIFSDTWNGIKDGFKSMWEGMKQLAGDGINAVIKIPNAGIDGINGLIHDFGGPKKALDKIPKVKFANGTGAIQELTHAVLNDGNDSPETGNKETLVHPNGKMEIVQGRNIERLLLPGTEVLNARETAMFMGLQGVKHFAGGTGFWSKLLSGAGNAVSNIAGSVWSGLKNGVDKFTKMFSYITGAVADPSGTLGKVLNLKSSSVSSVMDGVAGGAYKKVTSTAKDWWSTLWSMASESSSSGTGSKGDDYAFKNKSKDSGVDIWGYFYRECVSFVASRLKNMGVSANLFSHLGNGADWVNAKVPHSKTPKAGDVAVYGAGSEFGNHVSMVTGVQGNKISGEEYNLDGDGQYHTYNGRKASGATTFLDFGGSAGAKAKEIATNNPLSKLIKKQTGGMMEWIQKFIAPINDSSTGADNDVQSWSGDVKKALRKLGLSTSGSMVSKVLKQIQTESGGNARARGGNDGLADGNATGLMQVKPGTFRAYAVQGHNNIMNGYDNILAGLNYAKHRYGSDLSFLGQGHGYANGGLITQHQIAEIGEGNKPEMIIPLDGMKSSRGFELLGKTAVAMAQRDGLTGSSATSDNSDVIKHLEQAVELLTQLVKGQGNPVPVNVALDKNDLYKKQASDVNLRDYQSLA